jgi:hypothetical protein
MTSQPTRTRVESFTFIAPEDGEAVQYDGGFQWLRDGGSFEVTIPIDFDRAHKEAISERTAQYLTDRTDDIGVAMDRSGGLVGSGIIEACDVLEDGLVVRVNDSAWVDPETVPDEVLEEVEDG